MTAVVEGELCLAFSFAAVEHQFSQQWKTVMIRRHSIALAERTRRLPAGTVSLAGLYFLSSASMFFWAYMPRQMTALGWTGVQIGLFFAIKTLSQAVAMPAWGRLADRAGANRSYLLKLQYLVAAAAIAGLSFATSWVVGVIIAILIGATARCAPPLLDSMTLDTVGLSRFGRIRAFGTAGFGMVALLFGLVGASLGPGLLAMSAPWLMMGLAVVSLPLLQQISSTDVSQTPVRPRTAGHTPQVRVLLCTPIVLVVFPVAALFAATFVPYELFLVNLAEQQGFGAWLPGVAIFVGVVGEMLGFLFFRRITTKISVELMVGIIVAITAVRWLVTGTTSSAVLFAGLQILHGLTFAAFFMVMLEVMSRQWGANLGATPQGLLYLLVFTAGNGVGTLVAGILYDLGGAVTLFHYAGIGAFVLLPALVMAIRFARKHGVQMRPARPRLVQHRLEPAITVALSSLPGFNDRAIHSDKR